MDELSLSLYFERAQNPPGQERLHFTITPKRREQLIGSLSLNISLLN